MSPQEKLYTKYGLPGLEYEMKHCVLWEVQKDFPWFPAKHFLVNKDFKKMLEKAFYNLERAGVHTQIKTYNGCLSERNVRGYSDTLSLHAWAAALDLNMKDEQMGQRHTNWSGQFIAIMKAAGIYWGGHFRRPDPMHFAMLNG